MTLPHWPLTVHTQHISVGDSATNGHVSLNGTAVQPQKLKFAGNPINPERKSNNSIIITESGFHMQKKKQNVLKINQKTNTNNKYTPKAGKAKANVQDTRFP